MGKLSHTLPGSDYAPLPAATTVTYRLGSKYDPNCRLYAIRMWWSRGLSGKDFFGGTSKGEGDAPRSQYTAYLQGRGTAKPTGTQSGWQALIRDWTMRGSGFLTAAAIYGGVHHVMWRPTGSLGRITWFERALGQSWLLPKVIGFHSGMALAGFAVGATAAVAEYIRSDWKSWFWGFASGMKVSAAVRGTMDVWEMAKSTVRYYVDQFNRNLRVYATSWRDVQGGGTRPFASGSGHTTFAPFPRYY